MRILKYLVFLILILIIGIAMYIATLNGNYDIKSSRQIKAPVELVFNTINDYKNWKKWGPWYEMDSTIVAAYPDTTSGVGASYTWTGKEGVGSMKTISVTPYKEILQQINFGTGSTPEVYWDFNKINNETEVIWGMRGKNSFNEKIYWLLTGGIEKNMLPMYNRGLELLDNYLIEEMEKHSLEFKGIVDYGGGYYLYQTISCKIEDSASKMEKMFPPIIQFMQTNHIEATGKPFTLNHEIDIENQTVMFSACIPVKERIITTGDILTGFLEPQKTFKTIFKGNYKFLGEIWQNIYKALNENGLTPVKKGYSFEIYSVSPQETANPAEWITEIYIPIKEDEK